MYIYLGLKKMITNNVKWQFFKINESDRSLIKNQTPLCLWLTGLSGSGKSTIANILEVDLISKGFHTYILDGDNLRHGLNSDLSFEIPDRKENVRRAAEVSRLMVDAGLIVIVCLISPTKSDREQARALFSKGQFIEIYLSTSLEECERRDVKGLYKKARNGLIKDFTGIDSPYERPENPEITIDTKLSSADDAKQIICEYIL
jgi:adenylyl-sulfate kinase